MHEVVYLVGLFVYLYVCWHEASASFTWIFAGEILYAVTSYFSLLKSINFWTLWWIWILYFSNIFIRQKKTDR